MKLTTKIILSVSTTLLMVGCKGGGNSYYKKPKNLVKEEEFIERLEETIEKSQPYNVINGDKLTQGFKFKFNYFCSESSVSMNNGKKYGKEKIVTKTKDEGKYDNTLKRGFTKSKEKVLVKSKKIHHKTKAATSTYFCIENNKACIANKISKTYSTIDIKEIDFSLCDYVLEEVVDSVDDVSSILDFGYNIHSNSECYVDDDIFTIVHTYLEREGSEVEEYSFTQQIQFKEDRIRIYCELSKIEEDLSSRDEYFEKSYGEIIFGKQSVKKTNLNNYLNITED